jgi:UDP-3-O-[3-hydroxymyristoyl] glucosamine N-acyltransferase
MDTIISPNAYVVKRFNIGEGTIIKNNAVVNTGVKNA